MEIAAPADSGRARRRRIVYLVLAVTTVLEIGIAVWLFQRRPQAHDGASGAAGYVSYRLYPLRYDYHILSGTDSLCDLAADPSCAHNILASRPEDGRKLRAMLEQKLGLSNLDELRSADREKIERLKGLGYL